MQVAHEVHHGTVSKDAERMSGQLDTFKSEIKHDVSPSEHPVPAQPCMMVSIMSQFSGSDSQ